MIKIKVNQTKATFDKTQHKTLLDALEQQGFEPHYHCRDGYCGACRCKLISGDVSYTLEPIAFIHQGEILTCCSIPSNDIEIDLDH
jgi:ferredoxin